MKSSPTRLMFVLGACGSAFMMAVALLYFQNHLDLPPCPLCIFQRIGMIAIGLFCLLAALHNTGVSGTRIYCGLIAISAILGGTVSARHSWLQHLPADQVPACGPGLDYMLESFPFSKVLELVFTGSGECAEVAWSLMGLSIPEWTLVGFVGYVIYALLIAKLAQSN